LQFQNISALRSGGQIISDVLLPSWPAKLLKTHNLLRAQVPHPAVVWDEIEPLLERAHVMRAQGTEHHGVPRAECAGPAALSA